MISSDAHRPLRIELIALKRVRGFEITDASCSSARSTGTLAVFPCWLTDFVGTSLTTITLGSSRYTFNFRSSGPGEFNTYTNPTATFSAGPILLLWQSTDVKAASTTSGPNAPPTTPASASSDDSGLSQGAKIGIGVAAGVAGLLALLLVGVLVWHKRGKRRRNGQDEGQGPLSHKPELDGQVVAGGAFGAGTHEMAVSNDIELSALAGDMSESGQSPYELVAPRRPVELDDGTPRVELGSNR